jgi:hypothetical protein
MASGQPLRGFRNDSEMEPSSLLHLQGGRATMTDLW